MLNEYVVNTNILSNIHLNAPTGDLLKKLDSLGRDIAVRELLRLGFVRCDIYSISQTDGNIVCFDDGMFICVDKLKIEEIDEQYLLSIHSHLKSLGGSPHRLSKHQNYPMRTIWLFNGDQKFLTRRSTAHARSILDYTEKSKSLNRIDRIPLMGNNVEPIKAKPNSDVCYRVARIYPTYLGNFCQCSL